MPTMRYLQEATEQLDNLLRGSGVSVHAPYCSRHNHLAPLITAIVGMGLYPDVGVRRLGAKVFTTEKGSKVKIHPASINSKSALFRAVCSKPMQFMGYQDLVSVNQTLHEVGGATLQMLNTSSVSLFSLLLASGTMVSGYCDYLVKRNPIIAAEQPPPAIVARADPRMCHLTYTIVHVDGWLSLKIRSDHLLLLQKCKAVVAEGVCLFVQEPNKYPQTASAQVVDIVAKVLSGEQKLL